jgi:hypothetical protein
MKKISILVLVVTLLIPAASFAKKVRYEVVKVKNGGTISGKVKTSAEVKDPIIPITVKPKETPEETELEKRTCITHQKGQQAEMYIISPSNEVKNTLVIVENVKKGKAAPKKEFLIDNIRCRFDPLVGIAYVKAEYVIKNSDPLLHNTNLGKVLEGGKRRTVYNLALPHENQVIKKKNRVAGLIQVKCDAHSWMRAYVYSSRHPYVAITDANGNYEIKDLLPGKYTVRFWHEGFEEISREVEVKTGEVSETNVTFDKTITPAAIAGN